MRRVPLFSVVLLDQISLSIVFPLLTFIFFDKNSALFPLSTSYADRSFWYGICMALMCLSGLIVAPLLSFYSDIYGRRLALLCAAASAFIFALSSLISIWTGSLLLLLLGSFIGGRCTNTNPIAQAIIGSNLEQENKVSGMGYLQFFIAAGAFIGPIVGGYFAQFTFSLPCVIAVVFSITSIMVILLFSGLLKTKEIYCHANSFRVLSFRNKWLQCKFSVYNENITKLLISLILIQISWSSYYQFMPAILKNTFKFGPQQVGLFVGLIALWLCVAATFGIRIINTFLQEEKIIYFSAILILLGFLVINGAIWTSSQTLLWLSSALIPIGDVMAYCALTTLFSNAMPASDQGKIMGLCSLIVAMVWMVTALVGGILMASNVNLPLLVAPIGVISFLLFILFGNKRLSYDAVS